MCDLFKANTGIFLIVVSALTPCGVVGGRWGSGGKSCCHLRPCSVRSTVLPKLRYLPTN